MRRIVALWALTLLTLFGVRWWTLHPDHFPAALWDVWPFLPYPLWFATVALAGLFRRSRSVLFATLTLLALTQPWLGFWLSPGWMLLLLTPLLMVEDRPAWSHRLLIPIAWVMAVMGLPAELGWPGWLEHTLQGAGGLLVTGLAYKSRGVCELSLQWCALTCALATLFWGADFSVALSVVLQLGLLAGLVGNSHRLAFMDELTELPGRRALKGEMRELGTKYAIAMLDVDHFKQFNDTHGHDVGDQVLRMVASRMRKVGGGGRAFRYGGEEFTILFPSRGPKESVAFLEEVRESIANSPMVLRSPDRPRKKPKNPSPRKGPRKTVSVTISIGVAGPAKGKNPEQVMKMADKALYKAKKQGRNQTVC